MMDEGYIKFHCEWEQTDPLPHAKIDALTYWRNRLYSAGLIGMYPNGIGFGNVSCRDASPSGEFIITGTQTGSIPVLDASHYTMVTSYSLVDNFVRCKGPAKASSESMTHAVFYDSDPSIQAVVHVHHEALWHQLLYEVPTTGAHIPYGTPEMAEEVKRLFQETALNQKKIMAMAGHEEGIVTFGKNVEEAAQLILSFF